LIIAGEKESVPMKRSVIELAAVMPAAKGILLKTGVHTYPWSKHRIFNEIVEEWIRTDAVTNPHAVHLK